MELANRSAILLMAAAAAMLVLIPAVSFDSAGENGFSLSVEKIEGKTYAFVPSAEGTVTYDFGDGAASAEGRILHTFQHSGKHTVRAYCGDMTAIASVMIVDEQPPMTAIAGKEMRYAPPYRADEATAAMYDGTNDGWLHWDPVLKCAVGTPPVPGKYLVRVGAPGTFQSWDLEVLPEGTITPSAAFGVETEGLRVTLTPSASYDVALYYWSIFDSAGKKIFVSSDRAPSADLPAPGVYVACLKVIISSGVTEYSSIILIGEVDEEQPGHNWMMYGIAALAVIAFVLVVRFI